jgi:hypothetical protein
MNDIGTLPSGNLQRGPELSNQKTREEKKHWELKMHIASKRSGVPHDVPLVQQRVTEPMYRYMLIKVATDGWVVGCNYLNIIS